MTDPWGIVVVPTEAGRALLADGPCGAKPPSVHHDDDGSWCDCEDYPARLSTGLPMWWDHALVPEGWDRARRVADPMLRLARVSCPFSDEVLKLARAMEADGLCRLVLLDLVDGAARERAP